MLADAGVRWVLLGQSERRKGGDSIEIVASKAERAFAEGLGVIVSVGERPDDVQTACARNTVYEQLQVRP